MANPLSGEHPERHKDGKADPCEDVNQWRPGRPDGHLVVKRGDVARLGDDIRFIIECADESDPERGDEIQQVKRGRDEYRAFRDLQVNLPFRLSRAGFAKAFVPFAYVIW